MRSLVMSPFSHDLIKQTEWINCALKNSKDLLTTITLQNTTSKIFNVYSNTLKCILNILRRTLLGMATI